MADLIIRTGTCHAMFAYDVAYAINLDVAQERIASGTERQKVKQRRRAPTSFEYRPAPLRVTVQIEPITLEGYTTSPHLELTMYDFGGISVDFEFPIAGPLAGLPPLAVALGGNMRLLAEAFVQVERLVDRLRDAADRPHMSDVHEDYVIFEITAFEGTVEPSALWTTHAPTVAQLLRGEARPLAQQEVADATGFHLSFGANDATFIDTDATLLYDSEGDDVRAVIELANTQLMEMRHLDQQLDTALDQAYDMLARQRKGGLFRRRSPDVHRMAELQLDSAVMFEQVSNAIKLIGDQYLSRVYNRVTGRFQLDRWDASIGRKLATVEGIYTKMVDRATAARGEALEWAIVLLIVFEIVLSFLPGH